MIAPDHWRLFIAISLPEAIKAEIGRVQTELQGHLPAGCVRWTRPEQFHLTLRFLGDVAPERVEELTQALRNACRQLKALELRAERISFFPGPRYPRVIWAWVHDPADQLRGLQRSIQQAVAPFTSEREEKEFTGHVTLGRCHRIKRPHAETLSRLAFGMADRSFGEWTANRVELIRSELAPAGSLHSTLAAATLLSQMTRP